MKILCVADYHREKEFAKNVGELAEKEKADVIINAGDFLSEDFARKVLDNEKTQTFVVRGNWDHEIRTKNNNVKILENEISEYNGYYFLGVDWGHYSKITELAKGKDRKKLILITHDPPYDILDMSYFGSNAGVMELREVVERVKPIIHVFGHIHESAGVMKHKGILFVNAALPEFRKAVIVELPGQKVKIFDV
jgi:hypothetical protein